ncbi:unnamed protein product [Parnassius mnemosyne]|uniref:Uncharacterized protein n=1 Tax=Parnassius mnemosyne TaxID=213953 RepID=A0AAV1MCM5_9NEOP
MAAKFIDERWRTFEEKQNFEAKSRSQVFSQNLPKNVLIRDRKNEIKDNSYCDNFEDMETESDIIIWICRLTDFSHLCSITVKREHILSYNYTGEGLHIQNKQDPKIVFDSPECLIIRRQSVSKLLDDKDQIHVYIKVFK